MSVTAAPVASIPIPGLTEREAQTRRAQGRGNDAEIKSGRTYPQILRDNVFTFFNLVFFSLGLVMLVLGSPKDAFFTVIVALFNVFVTTFQEVRAKRQLDRIALLSRPKARVVRDGRELEIDPRAVVLGDLLVAGPGDQVIVDGIVVGDAIAELDESLLTGESNSVTRRAGDPVLSGSYVLSNTITYEATRVGAAGFASRLTIAARAFRHELTPLQVEVNWLVRVLLLLVVLYGLMVALSLWVHEGVTLLQVTQQTAVIIGLAPTGLFMMIVTAYALGAVRIAGKGALVQRINAVESLSNVNVLCLDKTGTLTSGRLALEGLYPLRGWRSRTGDQVSGEAELRRLMGVYASSGSARNSTTDAITRECPGACLPFVEEAPFSSARKWSALVFDQGELCGAFVLGAPEVLRSALSPGVDLPSADDYTVRGLRVLLLAHGPEGVLQYDESGQPRLPADLAPLCYVTLSDELRPEARQTLEGFRQAGIAVKILSGDHPGTVAALARQAGMSGDAESGKPISGADLLPLGDADFGRAAMEHTIFGRITPDQKQRLVRSLRDQGKYVAMTGDGINDVLALKQAQVSIAMQSGSQAAREVADMVLLEDSFAALPHAFQEGQRILNGMEDILKLTLTHVFALAFLITTISMVVAGFPYTPSENGLLTILSITIPTLGLTIWARPGPMPGGRRLWRLNRFVVPAALTTGLACLAIYLFAYRATRDHAYAQTMLTYGKTLLGLMLVPFLAPPTRFWAAGNPFSGDWRPTVLALATLVLLVVIGQTGFMQQLFGLTPLSTPTGPLVILAVSVLWVFATRWLLRTRLVERYLGVDWETPKEKQ